MCHKDTCKHSLRNTLKRTSFQGEDLASQVIFCRILCSISNVLRAQIQRVLILICMQQNSLWLSHIANAGSSLGVPAGYVGAYHAKVLCFPRVLLNCLITLSEDCGGLQSSKANNL